MDREAVVADPPRLLGPAGIRALAARLRLRPAKALGQNFVIDPNTVRRIVRAARLDPADVVVEVGPGLGSLTLGLLPPVRRVVAVEVDPVLAAALPGTVAERAPAYADRLTVVGADARHLRELPGPAPTALVANLPYRVAVPVLLALLERFPSIRHGLVMVQAEVAARLAAAPGSRVYGVPSVKTQWYADVRPAGAVPRSAFWPEPNVDSALVSLTVRDPPGDPDAREEVFALVDAAFAQRRKSLRAALVRWAGSPQRAEQALAAADVDGRARAETLGVADFARLAAVRPRNGP